jgi:hypothetical protein
VQGGFGRLFYFCCYCATVLEKQHSGRKLVLNLSLLRVLMELFPMAGGVLKGADRPKGCFRGNS